KWPRASENLNPTERMIVIKTDIDPGTKKLSRELVKAGGNYFNQFSNAGAFAPSETLTKPDGSVVYAYMNYIYGIDDNSDLRMPFNRADFYVRNPIGAAIKLPLRCAPNTGILFKAIIGQGNGTEY